MKRHHITAFYMETLLLIVVFISIILVLTRVFGIGKLESQSAKLLTSSVSLAENAAEAVSASESPEQLLEKLDTCGNAREAEEDGVRRIRVTYDADMTPDPDGKLCLDVTWEPSASESGVLVDSVIITTYGESDEPIYTLKTAVFLRGVSP